METWGTPPPAPRPGVGASQVPHCCGFDSHHTHQEACIALRACVTYADQMQISLASRVSDACNQTCSEM